jgi:hypothetical protein
MKKTLLLDVSHHSMRMISVCKREATAEEGYALWRYYFLSSIFKYIEQFGINEVVLAVDSKKNWRKDVFPWYKGHRKLLRDKIDEEAEGEGATEWFKFDEYYTELSTLLQEIKENIPFKVIEVESAEGDDVIGILTSKVNNEFVIVANDNDFVQLLKNDKVKLFNPLTKKFIECEDPKKQLMLKICKGDKGDFIPSISDKHTYKTEFLQYCVEKLSIAKNPSNAEVILNSDETVLYNSMFSFMKEHGIKPSRVTIFSEKVAAGHINNDTLGQLLNENEEMKKRFVRNGKLINLTYQPEELKVKVVDTYMDYEIPSLSGLFTYFVKRGYNGFLDDMSGVTATLKVLV